MSCLQNAMSTVRVCRMSCLQYVSRECHVYGICLQNVVSTVCVYRMSCLQYVFTECRVYRMSCLQYVSAECHVYSMCLQNVMSTVCVYRMSCLRYVTQNLPTSTVHEDSTPLSRAVTCCRLARSSPAFEGS